MNSESKNSHPESIKPQLSRFIPFRLHDLVSMCAQDPEAEASLMQFDVLAQRLSQLLHTQSKQQLDELTHTYAGLDPDTDTRVMVEPKDDDAEQFAEQLKALLNKANYEVITPQQLDDAMTRSSLFDLRLRVDFDDFSDVLLFCRGQSLRKETVSRWFGLRKREIEFINYDRVVVYVRYKSDYSAHKHDWWQPRPGSTLLKLFQNVPEADLEMLFPNTRLAMRTKDKLMIGVPALISGGIVVTTKMGATLILLSSMLGFWLGFKKEPVALNLANLTILFAGLGALSAFLWKQFSNFKNRKLLFMQQLTQNLYFKNLDNNAGVLFRLLNDAQEEEGKEALLAYYFLLREGELTRDELDQKIEAWLAEHWQCRMDFEIDDALAKLIRFQLVTQSHNHFHALPIAKAIERLELCWSRHFVAI